MVSSVSKTHPLRGLSGATGAVPSFVPLVFNALAVPAAEVVDADDLAILAIADELQATCRPATPYEIARDMDLAATDRAAYRAFHDRLARLERDGLIAEGTRRRNLVLVTCSGTRVRARERADLVAGEGQAVYPTASALDALAAFERAHGERAHFERAHGERAHGGRAGR